ncbi:MAG: hypothetical protein HY063_00455 [Bacteroidetes bacterium]|nr:hypothetical protein [Bacteroidota bacterium]
MKPTNEISPVLVVNREDLKNIILEFLHEKKLPLQSHVNEKEENDTIGIFEAMAITGYSKNTLYKKCCLKQIEFWKKPSIKQLFFSRKTLTEFMNSKK